MVNQAISTAVSQLKQEHIRLCKELARVDEALSVLGNLDGIESVPAKNGKRAKIKSVATQPKRKISAAARKKMSEAARARWAARKKEKTPAK
jgi:16S rRNA C1402 (ribose-2'-O) methylase RsmI